MAKRSGFVCQQLEMIASKLLEDYQGIIRDYIRRCNGVYALYKGKRLYYVGLATSLSGRLKRHLKDKHRGLWDHFSVYLTNSDDHIREMESLLVRISRPVGNKQIGKFARCENLKPKLKRALRAQKDLEIHDLFGTKGKRDPNRIKAGDRPILAKYISKIRRNRLRALYKGKYVRARVRSNGFITIRGSRGLKFNSPSWAAKHVVKRNMNGWQFWEYEWAPGVWRRLKHLRS